MYIEFHILSTPLLPSFSYAKLSLMISLIVGKPHWEWYGIEMEKRKKKAIELRCHNKEMKILENALFPNKLIWLWTFLLIWQAQFKLKSTAIMSLFFSFTTPVGIALGIGIASIYRENSPTALIVEGIFNSASAGILIYMALVDLLAADFMDTRIQNNGKLQLWTNVSLLVGAGCMSLLAKWAWQCVEHI